MTEESKVNVGEIVNKVIDNLEDGFSIEDVAVVIPQLIIELQKFKKVKAADKKELIEVMLKDIVDKTDGPGDDGLWDPILKRLIPGLVDTLLDIENGKLKLKKPKCLFLCK